MVAIKQAFIFTIALAFVAPHCVAQNTREEIDQKRLQYYRDAMLKGQNDSVSAFGNAKIDHFIGIADSAVARLYTPDGKANEIRTLARKLDGIMVDLLTNGAGRWIAKNEKTVRILMAYDTDALPLSDAGLMKRVKRLAASKAALEKFNHTQGEFDPTKSKAAKSIIEDAAWVQDMHSEISNRLALVAQQIENVPRGRDFSNLLTLEKVKQAISADDKYKVDSAILKTTTEVQKAALARQLDAIVERKMLEASTEIKEKDKLAKRKRELIQARHEAEQALVQSEIGIENAKREQTEAAMRESRAKAEQLIVEEYLTSPRVKRLLGPFCEPGMTPVGAFNKNFKIDELDPRPMSLSKLATYKKSAPRIIDTLKPSPRGVSSLVRLANMSHNDRPAWPTTHDTWESAGNTFEDMNGKMVNPYREAQRILRDHGALLVKLKMLVK